MINPKRAELSKRRWRATGDEAAKLWHHSRRGNDQDTVILPLVSPDLILAYNVGT